MQFQMLMTATKEETNLDFQEHCFEKNNLPKVAFKTYLKAKSRM